MTSHDNNFDAVVIGAGAGGLFAAARLTKQGYRTLVVERLDKVGGRASTDDIDGFKVNVGAIVIEVGGITQETCEEVGARFDIREPKPPILYRIGGKDVDVTGGGWGMLLSKLTRQPSWSRESAPLATIPGSPKTNCPPPTGCRSTPRTKVCTGSSGICAHPSSPWGRRICRRGSS